MVESARYEQAVQHTAFLIGKGLLVYSPIAHCRSLAMTASLPHNFDAWKEHNFDMISCCELLRVLTVHGWAASKGIKLEIRQAILIGIPVIYDKFLEYEEGNEIKDPCTTEGSTEGAKEA